MKVLVTGSNGYIGKRLIPVLLESGHNVVALVRMKGMTLPARLSEHVQIVVGDLLDYDSLSNIPKDIDIAYYLVHSMSDAGDHFHSLEEKACLNFIQCVQKTQLKQIIYLSGISNHRMPSQHMASRHNVEHILIQSGIATTILRAGIILALGALLLNNT